MNGPDNGCRIKTWRDGNGHVHDITFTNITMINTAHPLLIDTDYHELSSSSSSSPIETTDGGVSISKVTFHDMRAKTSRSSARIACQQSLPCTEITLDNVIIDVPIKCSYASGTSIPPLQPSSMASCLS
jgi:polygalacturonase